MKRLIAIALLACLLLCGCSEAEPATTEATPAPTQTQHLTESPGAPTTGATTEPAAEVTTEAPTEATTEAPTEATTEPVQAEPVTVYLLESSFMFDNGETKYTYDENYNILSYTVYTMEKELMYTGLFEEPDGKGMPGIFRTQWPDPDLGQTNTLTWEGACLKEEQYNPGFSGFQYEYNEDGKVTEKREYYEGILDFVTYYEYDGQTLTAAWCEDNAGDRYFDCRVENGLIVEKTAMDYSYRYEYDANGCLTQDTFVYEGESTPNTQYTYKAVQVPADLAPYILAQQAYLLNIA